MNKPNIKQLLAIVNSGWLRFLLLALLLIWLAQVLSQTFWLVWSGPSDKVVLSQALPTLSASQSNQHASIDARAAESWALFGREVDNDSDEAASTNDDVYYEEGKDAPETRLKLELLGVFAHADSELAGAIIQEKGKAAKLYHPGDDLPGRATLYKIYADRVLLKRVGVTEALSFDKKEFKGSISRTDSSTNNDNASFDEPQSSGGFDGDIAQQRNMVINQLALSPVTTGSAAGYQVTDGISDDVRKTVGLKPGDVILSVNGLPLGTAEADQQAIESFTAKGEAKVEVQRGSSRLTLTYPP